MSNHKDIDYYSVAPLSSTESLPIYAISKTMVADYTCAPPPEDFPDLSLYTVLILRGNLRFLENVVTRDGRAALIYSNRRSPNSFTPEHIAGCRYLVPKMAFTSRTDSWRFHHPLVLLVNS